MAEAAPVPMIAIQGVNKHFGALHVLKDVDLEVERGQVVVEARAGAGGRVEFAVRDLSLIHI